MTSGTIVLGRREIAHRLGRSERTVSRWIARGVLPATKDGPFTNSVLRVRVADLDRLARQAVAEERAAS